VCVLSLTGCAGDDDDPGGSARSTAGSTASPSAVGSAAGSATADPEAGPPKAPAAEDTPRARKAYAEFVVDRWGYALRTNDSEAVTALGPPNRACVGCRELRSELAKRKKQGWFVDFPGAVVKQVTVARGPVPPTISSPRAAVHTATARIDIPESRSYFDDGAFRNDNDAHKGATFTVRMLLDGKRYSLLAFSVT
jgi:hypothetical protein